jgi:PAS domain S-box-containing protein
MATDRLVQLPDRPEADTLSGSLIENLPAAVIATDATGSVVGWNRQAEVLFGWSESDIVGLPARRLLDVAVGPDEAERVVERVRAGDRWEGQVAVRRPDRSRVQAFVTVAPSTDPDGRPAGALAVALAVPPVPRTEDERLDALRREQAARAEAELLHQIAIAAAAEPDLSGILSATLERLGRLVSFTGGSIALVEQDDLVLKAALGPYTSDAVGQRLPRGSGQSWRILDSGEPWLCEDLLAAGYHIRGVPEENGPRSYLAVPLTWRDGTVGLLQIDSTEPGAFSPEDLRLMRAVGVALTGPIEVARRRAAEGEALAASEAAQARLAVLADASAALSSSLDYETMLGHLTEIAVREIADWCVVDIVEPGGEVRRLAMTGSEAARSRWDEVINRYLPPPAEPSTALARVLQTGEALLVPEITEELIRSEVSDEDHVQALLGMELRSAIVVPLIARGRTLGALTLIAAAPTSPFGAADLAFVEDLARRAATAIDTARLYSELSDFRSTVDLTHDGVLMFDPVSLRYFYANQGACDLTGYTEDELVAMTPLDLKPEFDETRFRSVLEPLVAGRSDSTVLTTTQRRKDGRSISVEILMQHVAPPGQPGRVITVVRDIGDRIEARVRLQRLAESERARNAELKAIIRAMGDAVLVVQGDGTITMANPAAEALFADRPLNRYEDVLARLDDPTGLAPPLAGDTRVGPVELRLLSPEERWLEVSAYPVMAPVESYGDAGTARVLETIIFMRDVTEARRARSMRDAFIGVLSHELRTPVTTIYGNSKLLGRTERQLEEPVRREVFTDIEVESERLYRLVEDLLVLARFGEGVTRLGREPLLLQRIVPMVVRSEEARWPGTNFGVEISPGLPTVQGDPTYVEQVVRNLIGNAAKYGGEGGNVRIVLDSLDNDVRLRVIDDGPGFAADEGPRLFELFYRSPGTATKASGAGIGLFVCRQLIEAMGGRIWASPAPEGGAEFGFTLRVFNEESE